MWGKALWIQGGFLKLLSPMQGEKNFKSTTKLDLQISISLPMHLSEKRVPNSDEISRAFMVQQQMIKREKVSRTATVERGPRASPRLSGTASGGTWEWEGSKPACGTEGECLACNWVAWRGYLRECHASWLHLRHDVERIRNKNYNIPCIQSLKTSKVNLQ